jgi:hypothetical protein
MLNVQMKLYKVILIFLSVNLYSQNNLMRIYPQVQAQTTSGFYDACDFNQIVKTTDGGYLISVSPYSGNIHSAWPIDYITIKTNLNFVPIWKQNRFVKSIVLSSGRIITIDNSPNSSSPQVSKITNSGLTVWSKTLTLPIPNITSYTLQINDLISYNNKVLCVGHYNWFDISNLAQQNGTTGFICELDTLGNITNQKLFKNPFQVLPFTYFNIFNNVTRGLNGDFFISGESIMYKFNSTFSKIWGFYTDTLKYKFLDSYILGNGDIFCLLNNYSLSQGDSSSVFLKLNSSGNVVFAKKINIYAKYNGMEKTSNGNFVISGVLPKINSIDTSKNLIMMVDSNANIIWAKKQIPSIGISKPFCDNNKLFYASYYKDLIVQSCDLNGIFPCSNSSINVSTQNIGLNFDAFGYELFNSTISSVSGNTYTNSSQNYRDTCGGFPFSIKENTRQLFKLSPNPSNGKIYINSDLSLDGYQIRISSVEGKLLRELFLEGDTLEINDLNQGIYFLTFVKDGLFMESKKVIITK